MINHITLKRLNSRYITILAWLFCINSFSQDKHLYKKIDSTKLYLQVYYPQQTDTNQTFPAMVFYFGGGWKDGKRFHFKNRAEYFSKRGIVCFLIDYRTESKNKTSPFESLKDAKSAIRFIKANATDFCIDENKIIASGGSAGGHLAAATALIDAYNEKTDDVSISSIPNALVLYNPVIDNGPGGYGYERIKDSYKSFSPLHNIKKGAPPTIIFQGTNDHLISVESVKNYKNAMVKVNSRCELILYEGQGHGFYNYKHFKYFKKTTLEADAFLQSLGYLKATPKIDIVLQ